MKGFITSKRVAVVAAVAVLAVAAIAAYAHFAAVGIGSGTALVGAGPDLVVEGTTRGTLYPGSTVSVGFTVVNPSSGRQRVGTVYLAAVKACRGTGSSWDPSAGACSNGGSEQLMCEAVDRGDTSDANAGDFYMADVTENQDIAGSSSGVALSNIGALKMNDLTVAQDSCQNANVYLELQTK